jgi:hypothetical protein
MRWAGLRGTGFVLLVQSVRALLPLLAFFGLVLSATAREIPFDFVDGYILVHASVHAQPVTLILDSGASVSVLSLEAAKRLHLARGEAVAIDGVNASAFAYAIEPVTAMASGVGMGEIGMAIDLSRAGQLCSRHVDGLIGAGFFDGRITQIDYERHRIRLLDAAPSGGESLRLLARNGVYCVPVSVNGSHPRWTRLDTGCNDELHWVVRRGSAAPAHEDASIGFITNTEDETVVPVRLGHILLPHVAATLHGTAIFPGEAGLLGSGILSQYRVTVDAIGGRIFLGQE